jgi:hypothetical protein
MMNTNVCYKIIGFISVDLVHDFAARLKEMLMNGESDRIS